MTLYDKTAQCPIARAKGLAQTSPSRLDASYVIVCKLHARPMQLQTCTSYMLHLRVFVWSLTVSACALYT